MFELNMRCSDLGIVSIVQLVCPSKWGFLIRSCWNATFWMRSNTGHQRLRRRGQRLFLVHCMCVRV